MENQVLSLADGRKIVVAAFAESVAIDLPGPFVVLLPAARIDDFKRVGVIVDALIAQGCVEVCCVGQAAERMHDQIDMSIETSGNPEVVTTWFSDEYDACEYVLFAAGGGAYSLLAMVLERPDLVDILKASANGLD